MKRLLSVLLCLLLLLPAAAPALGASARLTSLWVSSNGEYGVDAISWYYADHTYYLLIPGAVSIDSLKIGFSGAESIQVDGKQVRPGDSAALLSSLAHPNHTVTCGDRKYSLCVMQGSAGLPVLHILTQSGKLDFIHAKKSNKETGYLLFLDPDGQVQYAGDLTHIKMRGNSSTTFKKKNYQIKLAAGADLMGMGKSRTWVLTGNYRDKSLLRNQITLDMAMYAGLACTPEHITAEVYINNEYMGAYLFSEKVMIDSDRVDITDLEKATERLNGGDVSIFPRTGSASAQPGQYKAYDIPQVPMDITGGYLVEFEAYSARYREEASAYHTTRKNTLVVKSPEYCSVEQMEYISSLMQSFENAIFAEDGVDPQTDLHYTELVDLDSLVNKYLVEEVCKNYDGNNSSMFFYKPADSQSPLAYAGPCWDYDSAYGSYAREDNAKRVLTGDGFWINNAGKNAWWPALYSQVDFRDAVVDRYLDAFAPALRILLGQEEDEQGILHSLDAYAASIRATADMNFIRWPIPANPTSVAKTGNTFDKNIEYLRTFIADRYAFLNAQWTWEDE